ncbi:MAG: DUF4239 domain-containing protein [Methylotetracoccus sp.]
MKIDEYIVGAVVIATVTFCALLGLFVVRRAFHFDRLRRCHEVAGYLLSVVGTMYAVLLGLIVVDAMGRFESARTAVEKEANSLADIYLLAERLGSERGGEVRRLCVDYVTAVIDDEWPAMARGEVSLKARAVSLALIRRISEFEPVSENHKAVYPLVLEEAFELWDNRRARTNLAIYGVPPIEWLVLVLGGVVTITFTYFFSVESIRAQTVMTTFVSLLIALNVYLVVLFAAPFSGDLRVQPDAMELDRAIFRGHYG